MTDGMKARALLGLSLAAGVLLSACGGSGHPGGAASPLRAGSGPCSLATRGEVSGAMGLPFGDGHLSNSGDPNLVLCDFDLQGRTGLVSVGLHRGVTKETLKNQGGAGSDATPVSGIGEAAFLACGVSNVPYCTLAAFAGGKGLFIQASLDGSDDVALTKAVEALAAKAVARA